MRELILDPSKLEPFEIGASILSTLAFPGRGETEDQRRAARAWGAKQIQMTMEKYPTSDAEIRFARYARRDAKETHRSLLRVPRRLRNRMAAARMARAYWHESVTGTRAEPIAPMVAVSVAQLSILVRRETGESDPKNVEKRTWRLSWPVVHLAAAFDYFGTERGLRDIHYDLQDLDNHRHIVELARRHEEMALAHQRIGVKPEDLIRLRWVE